MEEHLARLLCSSKKLNIAQCEPSSLGREVTSELRSRLCFNGPERIRINLRAEGWSIDIQPYSPDWELAQEIDLLVVQSDRPFPSHKTTDYEVSMNARKLARTKLAHEALLTTADLKVREGAWSNVIWETEDERWQTTSHDVLPGVTLGVVSSLLEVEFVEISLDVLYQAKSIAITQSTTGVTPVSRIFVTGPDGPQLVWRNSSNNSFEIQRLYQERVQRESRPAHDFELDLLRLSALVEAVN